MAMTREEWEELKGMIAEIYDGRLRVLRCGSCEDDGLTLLPLEEGSGMAVPKLSVERRIFTSETDVGWEYESYSLTLTDNGRYAFNCLPLTGMSAAEARMSVEFAVSCLFGINDEEDKYLGKRP